MAVNTTSNVNNNNISSINNKSSVLPSLSNGHLLVRQRI